MRTGTKVSIAIAIFTCAMVFFLIVFVIFVGIWVRELRGFWQYIPETVTALLGMNGLAFVAVETRKAVECRANRMVLPKLAESGAEASSPGSVNLGNEEVAGLDSNQPSQTGCH